MDGVPSPLVSSAQYPCRLCRTGSTFFFADKKREYYQCPTCHLVFVPEEFMLSSEEEKAVYDLHDNVDGDAGYERFLSRASNPVLEYFTHDAALEKDEKMRRGLDFGCGPCPVLARMFEAASPNFHVDPYDLYYYPENAHFLERTNYYDFVTATEVVEHLVDPLSAIRQLWACLRPSGGILVIMTKRVEGTLDRFRNWHYIRDPTHITFFHVDTFGWVAQTLSTATVTCDLRVVGPDVVLFIKNGKVVKDSTHEEVT